MSNRSKKFVFVPFCLLAQAYQAQGIVKYEWKSSIKPIVQLLLNNDINMVQMPCAEASYKNSLIRKPQGITKYDTLEFNCHCEQLAKETWNQIKNIIENKYQVLAIIGIEQSLSCCINYIYTNKGMQNRMGLFTEKLAKKLQEYNIPFIGINRKYIHKALKELENVIKKENDLKIK